MVDRHIGAHQLWHSQKSNDWGPQDHGRLLYVWEIKQEYGSIDGTAGAWKDDYASGMFYQVSLDTSR